VVGWRQCSLAFASGSPAAEPGHSQCRQPGHFRCLLTLRAFPWLDHPPWGCRVPRSEARNRGYSYPSGGGIGALPAILRPRIPPNRRKTPRIAARAVFRASEGHGLGRPATESAKAPPTGGSSSPCRSRPSSRLAIRRGSRRPGRPPRRACGLEHLAAQRSRGGP